MVGVTGVIVLRRRSERKLPPLHAHGYRPRLDGVRGRELDAERPKAPDKRPSPAPASDQTVESRGVLSVATDRGGFESIVVGGLPQPWVRNLSAVSSPADVRVGWSPSASVPWDVVASYVVEELTGTGPVALSKPIIGSPAFFPVPPECLSAVRGAG